MTSEVQKLVGIAKTAIGILERNDEKIAIAEISNLVRQANRTDVVVMICGEFKRGKSSFINSLLNTSVCAVDSDIATASISVIKYGKETKITRFYADGDDVKTEIVAIENLEKYTKGNSQDVQSTVKVEIELNNEMLKNGLILIDSPGVGGMNPLHKHLTQSFIPQADIVLFMLHAIEPVSETEVNFYKNEICGKAKSSAFIMNKIDAQGDYVTKIEDAVIKLSNAGINKDKIKILPYSAELKIAYQNNNNERYLEKSNASNVIKLIESLVAAHRGNMMIEAYRCIYNSLENIKKIWVNRHKELADVDNSSLSELMDIAKKLNQRLDIIRNPNSEFNRANTKTISEVETHINTTLSSTRIEIRNKAEQMIYDGATMDDLSALLKNETEQYVCDIAERIYNAKKGIADGLESMLYDNNNEFSVDVAFSDEQKNKLQKYYYPVMVGMGIKGLLVSALGAAAAFVALPIAVLGGWLMYKGAKQDAMRRSFQRAMEETFVQVDTYIKKEMAVLRSFFRDSVADFSDNIIKRLKATQDILEKGKADKAQQQNEMSRIVKHEIEPINHIQAECLRQSREIVM